MLHELDGAGERLRDRNAGWVARRDSAEFLGAVAVRSLTILAEFREEMDVDVRRSVEKVMGEASAALAGIEPKPIDKHFTVEELAQACAKGEERVVNAMESGYEVQVHLKSGRNQRVYIEQDDGKDGIKIIRVFTRCGPPREDAFVWALRANSKLVHSALALEKGENGPTLILVKCFLEGEVTPREMRSAVKEIAYYGDWVESKMTGLDEL
ncbi:MAG: hypothetical protein AMXMBFR84_00550 [Candidatus Hydrogenedentota bacterium]